MKEVVIDGVRYTVFSPSAESDTGKPYVIVRGRDAGVHAGWLESQDDASGTVVLSMSRRLWRWHGRTLSGLALEGTDDQSQCKFGDCLPLITLRGWCEIIPCTEAARRSLESVGEWVND